MPIFMDRHDLTGFSAEDLAQAHQMDLEVQDKYGVKFMTYWFDEYRKSGFCLIDAPDVEAATRVHGETHGNVAVEVIQVDLSTVEGFLGRIGAPPAMADQKAPEPEPAFRTVMFTDIVGSTAMTARLGDERSVEMVRAHDSIVRRAPKNVDGREVKHTGDGMMTSFGEAVAGVRCARSIQSALSAFNLASAEPLSLRIGLDAGEPVADSNDLFGGTVQMAARLCAAADPDSIFVSETVRNFGPDEIEFIERGTRTLKGFAEPVPIFEAS
ncbi:MAG: nickel-binding protein [Paracoccaceae bacterium]